MQLTRACWLLVLLIIVAAGCRRQPISTPPEENRFTRTVLVDGLDEPLQLEFDRAGRVYFIERTGAVKRYDEATGQVTLLGRLPVAVVGEAGLIGLLLDRDFDRTRQLYVYFSSAGEPSEMRLSRFTLTRRDSIDLASEVVLMRWPYEVGSHFGGGMAWDAAGNLYLTTGDNSDATQYNPVHWTNDGGRGQDAQRTAGDSPSAERHGLRRRESQGVLSVLPVAAGGLAY